MDHVVLQIAEHHDRAGKYDTEQQSDHRVFEIARRNTAVRGNGVVDHLDRAVVDDIGNFIRQNIGNHVGQRSCLLRVGRSDCHPEQSRRVHSRRRNHPSQLLIGIRCAALLQNKLHIGARLQNGNIGIDQVGRCIELAGGDRHGTRERDRAVIDIEQRVCLVLGGYKALGVQKGRRGKQDAHEQDHRRGSPESKQQLCKVDLNFVVFFLHHVNLQLTSQNALEQTVVSVCICHGINILYLCGERGCLSIEFIQLRLQFPIQQ